MTISRGQMPRQLYGLGSLVKSVAKTAKKIVKSPIGKAAALYFAPMMFGQGAGLAGYKGLFGAKSLNPFLKIAADGSQGFSPFGALANKLGVANLSGGLTGFGKAAALTIPSVLAAAGVKEDEVELIGQDKDKLAVLLERGYRNLNKDASDEEVEGFVRANLAKGGEAEENAMQASGIMGLPLNENPAGITELDLRETGGFIPPVGVKEKADDIPAMLSNNEFVFTADAVRGMGEGDVNKGAERMYSMMKTLENGGRV